MKKVTKKFSNWKEVNDWWSDNPTARRIFPVIEANSIEEHNELNHNIKFPCEMTFEL